MLLSEIIKNLQELSATARIKSLKHKTLSAVRYLSLEQAKIITRVYKENDGSPVILKRARSLAESLTEIPIAIDPEELIVGNRSPDVRSGIVFPEAGISWLADEIERLPYRQQDPFNVRKEDIEYFKTVIEPYWRGKTLEDNIFKAYGAEIKAIEKVVKINQKDHAQGHICPDVNAWLKLGPYGLLKEARRKMDLTGGDQKLFYESVSVTLDGTCRFINRYSLLASEMARKQDASMRKENLEQVSQICNFLSENPPDDFRSAVQSVWFLFVILHMESNASSFSPGRMDQYLYPFFKKDIMAGKIDAGKAIELIDALFIKFNQIVYMRNAHSAKYFAGFPIGFNVTIGGQDKDGKDAANELSYLFLRAHDHIRMPQPNLTARLQRNSTGEFIDECSRVIGLGTGMPQIVNDESIIPSLKKIGIESSDANDYALVGCVELSPQGNYLGWSDAAMFNLVKTLELALNNGRCTTSGIQIGPETGSPENFREYADIENAFQTQIDHFTDRMIKACKVVEKYHQLHLPSPFLSSVVADCLSKGIDVTAGGAKYNYSGIQAIQIANIADSLAVLKRLVYEDAIIDRKVLFDALYNNFEGNEKLRQQCINRVPKYGNDVDWVDDIGAKWVTYFAGKLKECRNYRGGPFQMGLYTVSAHVPMGQNLGATPDGRLARTPLADGGLSPMYGRDVQGPTAVLKSVARIPSVIAGNGTLLNLKFFPSFFNDKVDREKFSSFLRGFVRLPIHHVQFNVINADDLKDAKADPESHRELTIRVAGYTAYFTELSEDLQDEIINRTTHG
jgi:pyruvate formate-lyase/glycerol dehydratase family glycyl radical enzyme